MIEARGLTKRYGDKTAVDGVSFQVRPGTVTGFLGPNGAGKSTTMRMIVGLDRPTAGSVTVNGKPYAAHAAPLREVGVLLDARAVDTARSAYHHLRAMAATHAIPSRRVREVIGMTGLDAVADKRVGGFSLGMGQRLGIAAALLGDPETLILDEPVNGLDPEGVKWVRTMVRQLAAEGRTVFISSHLMSEMSQTADELLVIGRGRIIASGPIRDVIASATQTVVRVVAPRGASVAELLATNGATVTTLGPTQLSVEGLSCAQIGDLAAGQGLALHELTPQHPSLEDAYLSLTRDEVEYQTTTTKELR
ncbi:ABC transporter ATP-binding protein [Tessaracoccus sp. MC1679]|uniref:ABC transporter ATP-binding protein n=1 Tax=Tessaracoccus sp. MC1679 TaxID=2760313 RepID=UPI0016039DA3|nr:ABC transporter ATP-binding protein [Tessaracoccus sp. MC1679]MBB1515364.1 ABC transporter ATP-binding protein [Tessaracoccus sp. MC1679]